MATNQASTAIGAKNGTIQVPSSLNQNNTGIHRKNTSGASWRRAYTATIFGMGAIVHIIASIVTIALYFLLPYSSPLWFAPLFGSLSTYLVFLILAVFICNIVASAEYANTRSYGLMRTRLRQLRARFIGLGIVEEQHGTKSLRVEEQAAKAELSKRYRLVGLYEAVSCYNYAEHYLQEHPTGLQWITGMGYLNVWAIIHRAEEALIKVELPEMVLRGAMHDELAIRNSTINNRDELLRKLTQAVINLDSGADVYFREGQFNENSEVLQQILEALNILNKTNIKDEKKDIHNVLDKDEPAKHAGARIAISEVRRTLNDFRDGLWEGLLRGRNRLLIAMGITGVMTHILLSLTIIMGHPTQTNLLAATAFYMIGAVTGLFGRLYNEENNASTIDDYGLYFARLIATPLLSGLAGICGVFISIILYSSLIGDTQMNSLANFFRLDPGFLLTAAVFGLFPNLVISGLQQKSKKYSSDLQKSKSGRQDDSNNQS